MSFRVTSRPWFGPKKYLGWGWRPVSWQGRLVSAIFVVMLVVTPFVVGGSRGIVFAVLIIMFGVVVVLTGDRPGGPSRRSTPDGNKQP
jgi:hypothetical protein